LLSTRHELLHEATLADRLSAAGALREIGRRLQIAGGNPFRAKAFVRGAGALSGQPLDLATLVREKRLQKLRGIGPALAGVIEELHRTGRSRLLDRLRDELPRGVLELSRVPTLSLTRIRSLQDALGIDSLEAACRAGRVRSVKGFGPRTEERLLAAIQRLREGHGQVHLHRALEVGEPLVEHMLASPAVARADLAGGLRRRSETVSSLPLVATGTSAEAVANRLFSFPLVESAGPVRPPSATAMLANGLPVRLTWVRPERYGSALVEETGASGHWHRLEALARERGLARGLAGIEAAEEAAFYAQLGLPWIPPELREGQGEVEAALRGELPPRLVTVEDIRGMVHCHTHYSDGRDSVMEMAHAARRLGMSYITITDHSPTAAYAGGVTLDRLERQWEDIARAQEATGIRILRGTESDILADGSLDYPDSVLEKLDVVVASIHNRYRMDARAMTERVTRALALPLFKIWGHARGRLIGRRPPFECDMERILDVAAGSRVAIEVNGDPYRLDMDPAWIREARKRGLAFVVSVDAHSTRDLANVRFGVDTARRGWLQRSHVLNTLEAPEFAARVHPLNGRS
jgi:DNA polymerase (family 10)